MKKIFVFLVIILVSTSYNTQKVIYADNCDWTMHRGNYQQTGATKDGCSLNADNIGLLWKLKLDKRSSFYPSLVIKDEIIYCGSDDKLFAIDIRNKKTLWSFKLGNLILNSPVIFNERIFLANGNYVYCLKLDGDEVWTFKTRSTIYSSPVVFNEMLLIQDTFSGLYCLNASTGEKLWFSDSYNISGESSVPALSYDKKKFG